MLARRQRQVVGRGVGVLLQQRRARTPASHRRSRTGSSTIHAAYGCWPLTGWSGGRLVSSGTRTPMSSCSCDTRGCSRREHGALVGAGDHPVRRLVGVAEHLRRAAFGHVVLLGPGGVARADHEQPLAVAAGVHDRHRRAGKQRAFLEAVDVGVALRAEHAQRGRERAQRGAPHHQAVARRLLRRDRVEREVADHRIERGGRHRLAVDVVTGGAIGRSDRPSIQPATCSRARLFGSARRSCIDGSICSSFAFCASIAARSRITRSGSRLQADPERRGRAAHRRRRCTPDGGIALDASGRSRACSGRHGEGRARTAVASRQGKSHGHASSMRSAHGPPAPTARWPPAGRSRCRGCSRASASRTPTGTSARE